MTINMIDEPVTVTQSVQVCYCCDFVYFEKFVWHKILGEEEGHTLFVGVSRLHSYGRGLQVYFTFATKFYPILLYSV